MSVDLDTVSAVAVTGIHRRYRQWVEREDLQQEAALYLWQHQDKVQGQIDRADNDGAAAKWIGRDISSWLERYARAEKARNSGYEPEDEAWYGPGIVALVLPAILSGQTEAPAKAPDGMPRGSADPAEGNTWGAMVADVKQALKALDDDSIHLLVDRYFDDMTYDAIAQRYGWSSSSTAREAVKRAETALVERLGGQEPKGCAGDCDHWGHDERLRKRNGGEVW